MKPIEVKLSLTKQQEEAAYIMERLDELATVLMDVYNAKNKFCQLYFLLFRPVDRRQAAAGQARLFINLTS